MCGGGEGGGKNIFSIIILIDTYFISVSLVAVGIRCAIQVNVKIFPV